MTAVGNAGGTGTLSAADGSVTTLSAPVTTQSEASIQGETLSGMIETDADVVPGDSGGPLLDAKGEVIGIDTAASTGQEIDGYAIPIDRALTVVATIRTGVETSQVQIGPAAFLGVELSSTTGYARGSMTDGALIAGVVDGDAAAEAGIAAGDTITAVGSTTVTDASTLSGALAAHDPGDRVKISWTASDGQVHTTTVTLGPSPVN